MLPILEFGHDFIFQVLCVVLLDHIPHFSWDVWGPFGSLKAVEEAVDVAEGGGFLSQFG